MKDFITLIFPKQFDNDFKGHKIALYVFYVLTAVTLWRSQHHLFAPDGGAQTIATVPLDTFTKDGAQAVIGVFGLWGLSQLIVGLLYLIVALKYRAMVPLMYMFKPIPTAGTAPGAMINIPFVILTVLMLLAIIIGSKKKTS